MRELLFEAYGEPAEFIYGQILYLEGIDARPDEEHVKQSTLSALKKLLECALIDECNKFTQEKYEEEYCYE